MEYAVYVAVPWGEDGDLIARAASTAVCTEIDFSVREKSDPSESAVELCFRIRGSEHPDEALSIVLEIYRLGREVAGLTPDPRPRASLSTQPNESSE